jgi:sporulation protein YlmC with PRC-barrel domain
MRLRALHHRPVVAARSGQQLGRVAQILLDLDHCRVVGFRLRSGGLLDRRWRLAALEDVTEVTDTAVILPDALALREDEPHDGCLALGTGRLPVRDPTGAVIGALVDAEVDVATGQVCMLFLTRRSPAGPRSPLPEKLPVNRLRVAGGHAVVETLPPFAPAATDAASG